jgi:hypothetical protein
MHKDEGLEYGQRVGTHHAVPKYLGGGSNIDNTRGITISKHL